MILIASAILASAWPLHAQTLMTDDDARSLLEQKGKERFHSECVGTERQERFEAELMGVSPVRWRAGEPIAAGASRIVGDAVRPGVFFFDLSTTCEYVCSDARGKKGMCTQVISDLDSFGSVAVDRSNGELYWFGDHQSSVASFNALMKQYVLPVATSDQAQDVALFYNRLVRRWRTGDGLNSERDLEDAARGNFRVAWSPYQRDEHWRSKFDAWWKRFKLDHPKLRYATTSEAAGNDFIVRGEAFSGFQLTIPEGDPPPKGKPSIVEWTLQVARDGTITELPGRTIWQ